MRAKNAPGHMINDRGEVSWAIEHHRVESLKRKILVAKLKLICTLEQLKSDPGTSVTSEITDNPT